MLPAHDVPPANGFLVVRITVSLAVVVIVLMFIFVMPLSVAVALRPGRRSAQNKVGPAGQ